MANAKSQYETSGKKAGRECTCFKKKALDQQKVVPAVPKFKSVTEYKLIQIFNSEPKVPAGLLKLYKQAGVYEIEKLINNKTIILDGDNQIIEKTDGSYQGQVSDDYDQIKGTGSLDGVGRLYDPKRGLYEG